MVLLPKGRGSRGQVEKQRQPVNAGGVKMICTKVVPEGHALRQVLGLVVNTLSSGVELQTEPVKHCVKPTVGELLGWEEGIALG